MCFFGGVHLRGGSKAPKRKAKASGRGHQNTPNTSVPECGAEQTCFQNAPRHWECGAQKRPRTGARRCAKGPTTTPQRATKRTPQGSQKDPQSSKRAPKGPAEPWKGSRSTRRAPKGFQKESRKIPRRTPEGTAKHQKDPQSPRTPNKMS